MPPPAAFDLLVVGDCNPDLLLVGGDPVPEFGQREQLVDRAVLTIGGSASITACGAARLGLSTALVAAVGRDHFGSHVLEEVAARGVDVSPCPRRDEPTGITVVLARRDDRAILTSIGAIAALTAADVDPGLLRSARGTSTSRRTSSSTACAPGLPDLVAAARAAGVTVSVDPQDDTAGGLGVAGLPALAGRRRRAIRQRAARPPPSTRARCPLVVVKRGPDGAVARPRGGRGDRRPRRLPSRHGRRDRRRRQLRRRLPGRPWLDRASRAPARCALGCACGALSTRRLGGTAAQPTLDEARAALR